LRKFVARSHQKLAQDFDTVAFKYKYRIKKMKKIVIILILLVTFSATYYFWPETPGQVLGETSTSQSTSTKAANLDLYFFDVGQGDSAMIKKGDFEMLVDGGPDNKVIEKLGQYLPYSDRKIEAVLLTHPHSDHVAGLVEVLRRYQVEKIYLTGALHTAPDYLEFLKLIKEKNILTILIDKQEDIQITPDVTMDILYPDKSFYQVRPENLNNSSIVFKLNYISSTALFMGDFENEETLTSSTVVAQVLKVGHHGSTNANNKNFLAKVKSLIAVISVGFNNSYGHPHYRTLYYLKNLGAKILRTDESGDIKLQTDGQNFKIATP